MHLINAPEKPLDFNAPILVDGGLRDAQVPSLGIGTEWHHLI
jgi:hypothetical protein